LRVSIECAPSTTPQSYVYSAKEQGKNNLIIIINSKVETSMAVRSYLPSFFSPTASEAGKRFY
jgi:hypothetical protein